MFGLRVRLLAGVVVTALALAPAGARAASPLAEGMQALYAADGSGRLFATQGGEVWERCNADQSVCEAAGNGREISTGSAAAGSVFRLRNAGVSPLWRGNLAIVSPPSVQGALRANELVLPKLASWQGGWEGDFDQTQLAVCETSNGEGCTSISDYKYIDSCEDGGAVLDPSFAGEYLRVADQKRGPGTIETLEAHSSPFGQSIWPAQGNIAVAMMGQIGPATHARTASCGPGPLVEAWISSRGVAKVSCLLGCEAALVGRHGPRVSRMTLKVRSTGSPAVVPSAGSVAPSGATLRLSRGARKRLGPGRAKFTVEVGGHIFARRTVVLTAVHKHRRPGP